MSPLVYAFGGRLCYSGFTRFSFVELIRLRERLSHILGRPADLTTREGLHPMLRPQIEAAAVKVF
jgi:predicted nucleotidyltransferase